MTITVAGNKKEVKDGLTLPVSHAGIIRFKGQLMTYIPGQGPCYRCVFRA